MSFFADSSLCAPRRSLASIASLSAAVLLAACAKSSGGTQSSDTVTRTVGASGGAISLQSADVKATVTFPAGALQSDTSVTLQALAPVGAELARLQLQPTGVAFDPPVTVVLELPATRTLKPADLLGLTLGGKEVLLPTTVDVAAHTLSAQVRAFGLRDGAPPTRAAAEPGRLQLALASTPGDGVLTAQELAVIQPELATLEQALVDLQATGRFQDALLLQTEAGALVRADQAQSLGSDFQTWLTGARTTACAGLNDALRTAQTTPIAAYGDYQRLAKGIAYWEAVVVTIDATCGAPGAAQAALAAKLSEALTFTKAQVAGAPDPGQYPPLAGDIQGAEALASEAAVLGLDWLAALTRSTYVDPTLVPALEAAFRTGVQTGSQAHYVDLVHAFGARPEIGQDAEFVATQISMASRNVNGVAYATATFGRGPGPGQQVQRGTLVVNPEASIQITGTVATLHCPNPSVEHLQVTFEGFEVANVASDVDVLLGASTPLPGLTGASLLRAAGIAAGSAGRHTLEIKRLGSACVTTFGLVDDVLASATLDFSGGTCRVCGDPTGATACTNPGGCTGCGGDNGCGGRLSCDCPSLGGGNPCWMSCDTSGGYLGCWEHCPQPPP